MTSRRATFHLRADGSEADSLSTDSRPTSPAPMLNIPRSSSPLQQSLGEVGERAKQNPIKPKPKHHATDIGVLDDEVYDRYLPKPAALIRRALVWSLRKETPLLDWQQRKMRTPALDKYFVYTSLLGTHTFFLILLPLCLWLGNQYFARGLISVLAFGVYFSSALKDWLCVPRPYSPPVTRLTIGTHHLEYGFLSTHSTNAISIASYVYFWVRALRQIEGGTLWDSYLWEIGLIYYSCSVVYGRVYCGMHSMVDCTAGSLLGLGIAAAQWYLGGYLETFLLRPDWSVPLVIIPLGLLIVSIHPQPLDDCPCFEDAIAFIAVTMGISLSRWVGVRHGIMPLHDNPLAKGGVLGRFTTAAALLPKIRDMTSVEAVLDSVLKAFNGIVGIERGHPSLHHRIVSSVVIVLTGVTMIITTRLVTKTLCKLILPPVIRFIYETFGLILPRRHYVPATEYENIPLDKLRSVPSILDLPNSLSADGIVRSNSHLLSPVSSPGNSRAASPNPLQKQRSNGSALREFGSLGGHRSLTPTLPTSPPPASVDPIAEKIAEALKQKEKKSADGKEKVKRYDADVLTKVLTYSAIGFNASLVIPAMFERFGWAP